MPYFHCAATLLGPGSVICPGNWGRIIRLYRANEPGTYQIGFRERLLEDVRLSEFPNKPSRLSSSFVLETLEEARLYRDTLQRLSLIYEVEPTEEPQTLHRGNYNLVGLAGPQYYFDAQTAIARSYWAQPPAEHIEVLFQTPIRVLRCTDDTANAIPGMAA